MAHSYNPSILAAEAGRSGEVRSWRKAWPTWWNPVSTKNTIINWASWHLPVIPATQEAEAEELPEPRRRRLWWAKIAPLHSSLGNKSETPSQKKKRKVFPQGMLNSPTLCQYHVNQAFLLSGKFYPNCKIFHFMDNILLAAPMEPALLSLHASVQRNIQLRGLTTAPEKVQMSSHWKYFGYILNSQSLRP